jgi:hypothetical protein
MSFDDRIESVNFHLLLYIRVRKVSHIRVSLKFF